MIRRLAKEEHRKISDCINNLIYKEMKKHRTIEAVYVTAYETEKGIHIYVNFVDTSYMVDDLETVSCRIKGIQINKVIKSSWGFSSFLEENVKARKNARELLSCFFVMTRYGWYENYIESAINAGLTRYDNATAEQLLDMSETKKLTFYDWYAIHMEGPGKASLTKYNITIPLNLPLDIREVNKLSSARDKWSEIAMRNADLISDAKIDTSESAGSQKTMKLK